MNHGMPCTRECPGRSGTCHDTCEEFLVWKRKLREMKDGLRKERREASDIVGVKLASTRKKGKQW